MIIAKRNLTILQKYLYSLLTVAVLSVLFLSSCQEDDEAPTAPLCDEESYIIDESKINRKVLIIGIDGFRSDVMTVNNSPFLYNLSLDPCTYFTAQHQVEYYTSSGPNWTSLMTGVHWEKHLVENNFFSAYDSEEHPPFFYYIEQAKPSIHTASVCHWVPINGVINDGFADYSPFNFFSDTTVYTKGLAMVNQRSSIKGDVIFLHFDDLDHFGHGYGYHDTIPAYTEAVSIMDAYAESLFNAVEHRRSLGEDWIVFIVSDHGGEEREHSGKPNVPSVNQTIFYAHHPTISFKSNYISSQADLAPSVLSFLGIQNEAFSCLSDGNSILE